MPESGAAWPTAPTPGDSPTQGEELHFFDDETQAWPTDLNTLHRHFQAADAHQLWERQRRSTSGIQRADLALQQGNSLVAIRSQIEQTLLGNGHRRNVRCLRPLLEQEDERCREPYLCNIEFSHTSTAASTAPIKRLWRSSEGWCLFSVEDRLSPRTCLDKIWEHLKIPPGSAITPLTSHKGEYDQRMDPTCRKHLRKIFWQEIGQLEHLLGWDCSDWLRS